jgi:putative glutamine amidotransferase
MNADSRRPLIGITAWLTQAQWSSCQGRVSLIEQEFVEKIEQAGGRAVIVPPDPRLPDPLLELLDGLILSGGGDVDPAHYGAARERLTVPDEPVRDAAEIALAREALARDLPTLGICRGCQVLNLTRGGTLLQHVPDQYWEVRHALDGDPAAMAGFVDHAVRPEDGTPFASLVTRRHYVKSSHHQAIDRPGEGVVVGARSDDGLIEAIYLPQAHFALGVQWHPEVTDDTEPFTALVEAAAHPTPIPL